MTGRAAARQWPNLAALGFLALGAAWLGLVWGRAALVTETEVIERYAARYLADRARDGTGDTARITDCHAVPGQAGGIWLVVVCGPGPGDPGRIYEYRVNRMGGLEAPGTAGVGPAPSPGDS